MSNAEHKEWLLQQKELVEEEKKAKAKDWKGKIEKEAKKKKKPKKVVKKHVVEEGDDDDDETAFDKDNKWGESMEEDQEYLFFE